MYTFVKAVCLSRSIGAQWQSIDIRNLLLSDIYNKFAKCFVELTNSALTAPVYVDLLATRAKYSSYPDTFEQWLVTIGDEALQTIPSLPDTRLRYVKYSDAVRSGYKIQPTKVGVNYPANYPVTEQRDLVVTRPHYNTDLSLIHTHCLVSVNGYIHRTDTDGNHFYVYDGADTQRRCSENHMGITSFLDVGRLMKEPIDLTTVHGINPTDPLKTRLYFTSKVDSTNKTPVLILGGHMVFIQENIFWQTSEFTYALNPTALPLLERYFQARSQLDYSSVRLPTLASNPDLVNINSFYSDDNLKSILSMSQTFLVLIDTPELLVNRIHLRKSSLPGMITSYQDPTYPLITGDGRLAEYWKTQEDGHWSMTVYDSQINNYIFRTVKEKDLVNITNQRLPYDPSDVSRGYLLQLSTYR